MRCSWLLRSTSGWTRGRRVLRHMTNSKQQGRCVMMCCAVLGCFCWLLLHLFWQHNT